MLQNLAQLGYAEMTPVQAQSLPLSLAGRDVTAQAATGSGKTAAFGLAILKSIRPGSGKPAALVLCPTRELATQVAEELRRLARPLANTRIVVLCGGSVFAHQREAIARGVDIVVGTPGRVLDHVQRRTVDLRFVKVAVLDEADRMLEMGFLPDVTTIFDTTPRGRQTLLFSATFPDEILAMREQFQKDPATVIVESVVAKPDIDAYVVGLDRLERTEATLRVLGHFRPKNAVIFCNHRASCDELVAEMRRQGFVARALHGGMDQRERDEVLLLFAHDSLQWLVATDVAARGLDIEELAAVVNYDPPRDADVYTHRIGRTGRAGKSGLAVTLLSRREQRREGAWAEAFEDAHRVDEASLGEVAMVPPPPEMVTIAVYAGRRDKIRKGDILGALTGEMGLAPSDIGKITITDTTSYVGLRREVGMQALRAINNGQIKRRRVRASMLDERA